MRIKSAPRALPLFESRAEISALRVLFYNTFKKFDLFAYNSNTDVLRRMRRYLKFMLLLKRSAVRIFSQKLGETLSSAFVIPLLKIRALTGKVRLFKRETLNFLFNILMKAKLIKILGFPK